MTINLSNAIELDLLHISILGKVAKETRNSILRSEGGGLLSK